MKTLWWSCEQRLVCRCFSDFSSSRSDWSWSSRWALAKLFMIQQRRDICCREGQLARRKPVDSRESCYRLCLLSNWSWMQENTGIHQPRQNQIRKYIKELIKSKKAKGLTANHWSQKQTQFFTTLKKKFKNPKSVDNLLTYDIFSNCSQTLANHIGIF